MTWINVEKKMAALVKKKRKKKRLVIMIMKMVVIEVLKCVISVVKSIMKQHPSHPLPLIEI